VGGGWEREREEGERERQTLTFLSLIMWLKGDLKWGVISHSEALAQYLHVGNPIPNYTKHGKLMSYAYNALLIHHEGELSGFWDITKSFFLSIVWLTPFDSQKKKPINNQPTGKKFPLFQFGMANMETLSKFKSCLKNICVLWTSHLFITREVGKINGIEIGYNCFNHPSVSWWWVREHNKGENS